MVVYVAQVNFDVGITELYLTSQELVDGFGEGCQVFSEIDDPFFDVMDFLDVIDLRLVDELVLCSFDVVAYHIHDEEVLIDDVIYQGIEQVFGVSFSDAALRLTDPLFDGMQQILIAFLQRQQVGTREDQADMPELQGIGLFMIEGKLQGKVKLFSCTFTLRQLIGIDDILQGQVVNIEGVAQLLDGLNIAQTGDVDPVANRGVCCGQD